MWEAHGHGPTLFLCLHWLGGSAQSFRELGSELARRGYESVALDMPGFGSAEERAIFSSYSLRSTVDAMERAIATLRREASGRWVLVGHSMGGKVATMLARRSLDGAPGLEGLAGLLLVSPSPPSPEPMTPDKRAQLLEGFAGDEVSASFAAQFVDDNTAERLEPAALRGRTVGGITSADPAALRAWLLEGSLVDARDEVGTLSVPARVFVGTSGDALGAEVQRKETLPHLPPETELVTLAGVSHLAPLECPLRLAEHFEKFAEDQGLPRGEDASRLPRALQAALNSPSVSLQTRRVLLQRVNPARRAPALSEDAMVTLAALTETVLPGSPAALAERVEASIAQSNGTRNAHLPTDTQAWPEALACLEAWSLAEHSARFAELDSARRQRMLERIDGASPLPPECKLPPLALHAWFEELRAECVRAHLSDPRGLLSIGYDGYRDLAPIACSEGEP